MPERNLVQEWRQAIAVTITFVLIVAFAITTIFALIGVGRWIIEDAPGDVPLRGATAWLATWVILNLWALGLRKLN